VDPRTPGDDDGNAILSGEILDLERGLRPRRLLQVIGDERRVHDSAAREIAARKY
jgi:hypothetical protein